MNDPEYQEALVDLRDDWGKLSQDPDRPGVLRAKNDPSKVILVGRRADLIAEIINRATGA